jgi:opacity protein-like surface antigen
MRKSLMFVVLGLSSLPSMAQEFSRAELFGGYQYLRFGGSTSNGSTSSSQAFPGWNASFAFNFNRYLGATGDVGAGYATINGVSTSIYTFTTGPMVTLSSARKVNPYVHALFGAAYAKASVTSAGTTTSVSQVGSTALLGGGVDVKVTQAISVRVIQADWLYYRFGSKTFGGVTIPASSQSNNVRLSIGLVYRFTPFS